MKVWREVKKNIKYKNYQTSKQRTSFKQCLINSEPTHKKFRPWGPKTPDARMQMFKSGVAKTQHATEGADF